MEHGTYYLPPRNHADRSATSICGHSHQPPVSMILSSVVRGRRPHSSSACFVQPGEPALISAMKGHALFMLMLLRHVSAFASRGVTLAKRTEHTLVELSSTVSAKSESVDSSFNPLGPPEILTGLAVGETLSASTQITRLSQAPDLFHIKNFVSRDDANVLIDAAATQGMKIAGTRQSEANTVRKNSYLTWIDPYDISGITSSEALSTARSLVVKSGGMFVHKAMQRMMQEGGKIDYIFAEDVQVAKYDTDGSFDYHHDGFSRYLTVLVYLNGIGGTYFPFANMGTLHNEVDDAEELGVAEIARGRLVGKEGILLVGKEGLESYAEYHNSPPEEIAVDSVFKIEAGDAIAFYSYRPSGKKDWRSVHCSLRVPQEKWISTCWFRSEALTGPFSHLKKEAMLETL